MNIIENSIQFDNTNKLKPELKFIWNKTDNYNEEICETIELLREVYVCISNADNDSLKYNVTLLHPFEIAKLLKKTDEVENIQVQEELYQQQIDTDPNFID